MAKRIRQTTIGTKKTISLRERKQRSTSRQINYLYNLEDKSISALGSIAKIFFANGSQQTATTVNPIGRSIDPAGRPRKTRSNPSRNEQQSLVRLGRAQRLGGIALENQMNVTFAKKAAPKKASKKAVKKAAPKKAAKKAAPKKASKKAAKKA